MGKIVTFPKKKDMNQAELVQYYVQKSKCSIKVSQAAKTFYIELHGQLANIPNLKNSKPNWGGISKDCEAKLIAMDSLFFAAADFNPDSYFSYGREPVLMLLICGERSRKFDLVGCVETVQDWLEPPTKIIGRKTKRHRGWGIGLVEDDSAIAPFALHSHQLGIPVDHSTIVLKPFSKAKETVAGVIAAAITGLGE